MPDESIVKLHYDEATARLIQQTLDQYEVRPGTLLDFLVKGLKESFLFPNGEDSFRGRYEESPDGGTIIIIDFENTFTTNFEREERPVTNSDLYFAATYLYAVSRKILCDFWDTSDPDRIKIHVNAEERLLDFARGCKQYASPLVWQNIVTSVIGGNGNNVGEINQPYMASMYGADTEHYIMHNTLYGEGPVRINPEPLMGQFIDLINGKSKNAIPSNLGFLNNFFLTLKLSSAKFAQFFENEREETLGEIVSRTED